MVIQDLVLSTRTSPSGEVVSWWVWITSSRDVPAVIPEVAEGHGPPHVEGQVGVGLEELVGLR